MNKTRIVWIDVLKFFGIFAIYLGHFGMVGGWSYQFVFSYHVPLFFFVAGCTESMSHETKVLDYIRKKIKVLLIPWFVFAILSTILITVKTDASLSFVKNSLVLILKGTIRNTFFAGSLWFLTCLFIVSIIFYFIRKLKYKSIILVVSLLMFIISERVLPQRPSVQPSEIFNVDSALYYIVFFAIGYISFEIVNDLIQQKNTISKIIFNASGMLSLAYTSLLFFQKDIFSFISDVPFLNIFKPIITALIVVWFFIYLSYICKDVKIFNDIGKNTLYLCGSEHIIKELFFSVLGLLSLGVTFNTPLDIYICTFVLLYLAHKFLVPVEKRIISKITTFIPKND